VSKKNLWITYIIIITGIVLFGFANTIYAETFFGCPKDEIATLNPGKCPVCGNQLSEVKEGYIENRGNILLDTLSEKEKDDLGIKNGNKAIIVVYSSPSGKASFEPGPGLTRKPVHLQYDCDGLLLVQALSDKCQVLGDAPGYLEKEKEEQARIVKEAKEKEEQERLKIAQELKLAMNTELEESWTIFYRTQKELGLSEEEIRTVWEDETKKVYEKYGYDPETDSFSGIEIIQPGGANEEE
jgi:ATP-dependent exoDNAse (exonuclease V) alpha subunit